MRKFLILRLIIGVLITISSAWASSERIKVSLIPQYRALHQGQNTGLLVKFELAPNWHIFSENTGEIGMPTSIKWILPDGVQIVDGIWSKDEEFINEGIVQRGFSKLAYFQTAIVPKDIYSKTITIDAEIKWLACNINCYPEKRKLTLVLPISEFEQMPTPQWQKEFSLAETLFEDHNSNDNKNIITILLMAFIGGIIINAMPCIFPVLAIKVMSLVQTTQGNKQHILKALAYCIGVVASFMIIATIMLLVRAGGTKIGWGFQLQSPVFVGFMIVLFVFIGLLLLDVVTINTPISKQFKLSSPILSSLATGFLAVLIATPCTAPFMGIAIGYALNAPISTFYPVFLSLGLGYALPFTLAEIFPKQIQKILPSSGRWMDRLKKIFSIPVFLTALWLGWVLYNQLTNLKREDLKWNAYDQQEVQELVQNNENVFINFTAKWCLTCIINKKTTLQSKDFEELVKKYNIKLFEADWTNNDTEIADALERYGRNSVPLYVFYQNGNYKLLPQILTPKIIKNIINIP